MIIEDKKISMAEVEANLWDNYQKDRSIENRNALVTFFYPLVKRAASFAARHNNNNLDNALSAAGERLIRCVELYDGRTTFEKYTYQSLVKAFLDVQRRVDKTRSKYILKTIPISFTYNGEEYSRDIIDQHDYIKEIDDKDEEITQWNKLQPILDIIYKNDIQRKVYTDYLNGISRDDNAKRNNISTGYVNQNCREVEARIRNYINAKITKYSNYREYSNIEGLKLSERTLKCVELYNKGKSIEEITSILKLKGRQASRALDEVNIQRRKQCGKQNGTS